MFTTRVLAVLAILGLVMSVTSYAAENKLPSALAVAETSCEYAANPVGIDAAQPRFTWVLQSNRRGTMQQAYQVLVASSSERLADDTGDLWDSGKVLSDDSVNIVYQGKKLASRQRCLWKVRVWGDQGQQTSWSKPAAFEMGLLEPTDWQGKWIGLAGENVAGVSPLLRKQFSVRGPVKQARLYAAGIGWSEYYLNGKRIGDHVLDPAATDYDKRILYVTHDVTQLVRQGPNALGAMLGNGWFSEPPGPGYNAQCPRPGYADAPCLLIELVLELVDGTVQHIVSDESWRGSTGPILRNDLFGGEVYDARQEKTGWLVPEYDDSDWPAAALSSNPGGRLEAQRIEPIKVNQMLKPVTMTNPAPNVYVYDFGRLFGGWARLRVQGPAGTKIALRYSDQVFSDSGLVDKRCHHGPDGATDYYILKGDPAGECYEPRFTYHPVRYVQVEGFPGVPKLQSLEGCVVHSSVDMTGDFRCSNQLLNQIHRNCIWTFANTMYGIELDCLYREHWGWIEPASNPAILYTRRFIPQFWTKFFRDVQCAQHADGVIPDVVPAYPLKDRKTGDPAWAGNYPLLVWHVYQSYGDRWLLESNYPSMKRWLDHLESVAKQNLIETGMYGDHMLPGESPGLEEFISKETPPALLWTGFYYRNVSIMAQAARVLGNTEDAVRYETLAAAIHDALNNKWLDAQANRYATGSQTANVFPLALGIVPAANQQDVLNGLVDDILQKRRSHLHMGVIGLTSAMDSLVTLGRGDVLYRVATTTDYPGWGYMVQQGATAIWECWGGGHQNLPMKINSGEQSMMQLASIVEFLYGGIAGLEGPAYFGQRTISPGFREMCIRPCIVGDLTSAAAHVRTVRGLVSVEWRRTESGLELKATVPVNASARISVPKAGLRNVTIAEGGKVVWEEGSYRSGVSGITGGVEDPTFITLHVGSGNYHFTTRTGHAGGLGFYGK